MREIIVVTTHYMVEKDGGDVLDAKWNAKKLMPKTAEVDGYEYRRIYDRVEVKTELVEALNSGPVKAVRK